MSNPESAVITWIGLRRVHSGGVANVAGCWVDGGRRLPSYLPAALDDLTGTGLITLADDGPHGPLQRASLTDAGQARYTELLKRYGDHIARAELDVPGPEFDPTSPDGEAFLRLPLTTVETTIETPAGRRLSDPRPPAPGGQPDPTPADGPTLHWARDPHDEHMHSVATSCTRPTRAGQDIVLRGGGRPAERLSAESRPESWRERHEHG